MSVLLFKVLWYPVDTPTKATNITDGLDMNIARGIDIKNNVITLNLKNAVQSLDSSGDKVYKYVDESGDIKFKEDDQIKVYVRYTDDMADVEDTTWATDTVTPPSSDYLKGVYYYIEHDAPTTTKGSTIKIKCADKCYILFNRLWAKTYSTADALTAPEIIQAVVRHSSESQDGIYTGDGANPDVTYDVDAKFDPDGYIEDTRLDGSSYPTVALAKIWKPVYDWISELSQIENLNSSAELAGTLVEDKPFMYWVDENNKFHWQRMLDYATTDEHIVIGTTTGIYGYSVNKSVFDVNNFIIYRGGSDLLGKGILDYYLDPSTNLKALKMRVVPMTDIGKRAIETEISRGNMVENTAGTLVYDNVRYNRVGNPTTFFDGKTYTSDTDYNTGLCDYIKKMCKSRAQTIAGRLGGGKYKGTIDRKGVITAPGTIVKITNLGTGVNSLPIRVMDVRDTINKTGWFTQWSLQEDPESVIQGAS